MYKHPVSRAHEVGTLWFTRHVYSMPAFSGKQQCWVHAPADIPSQTTALTWHITAARKEQTLQHGCKFRVLAFQGWQNLPGQKPAELSGGHRAGDGRAPLGFAPTPGRRLPAVQPQVRFQHTLQKCPEGAACLSFICMSSRSFSLWAVRYLCMLCASAHNCAFW